MQPQLASVPFPLPSHLTGLLKIDTKAIVHNYKTLKSLLPQSTCAAVLKADAYGFGTEAIAPLLASQGCNTFFVAHLEEGLLLRKILKEASIYVLSGLLPESESFFSEHNLIPILNDFEMVKRWVKESQKRGRKLGCSLHFDTGMNRSGFDQKDRIQIFESLGLLDSLDTHFIMSHLASSQDAANPMNVEQRKAFDKIRMRFPKAKTSLADTGGIYLGSPYHYDIARPGKGLFGLFTTPENKADLQPCLTLLGRIIQVHTASKGETVGYGSTYTLTRNSKLATIGIGFADGYDRRFSNKGCAMIHNFQAPVLGRISMDYTVIDITDIPESLSSVGEWVEFANKSMTLDKLAKSIDTISRELSTGFGQRLHRIYQ